MAQINQQFRVNLKYKGKGYPSIVSFYPKDNTIGAREEIYNDNLGNLIEKFGPEAYLESDCDRGYYDNWESKLYINFNRAATDQELDQILPQVEKQREQLVKQQERNKRAEEKRKQKEAINEKKYYLRLKKKYEGKIND